MWGKTRDEARSYWANTKWLGPRYQYMLDLDDEFPEVGLFEPTCISAEVGPGWVPLLRPVLRVLSRYGCHATQVKQKFCVLVVYWEEDPGRPLTLEERAQIDTVLATCVEISTSACEECGRYVAELAGKSMGGRRHCDDHRRDMGTR